MKKKFQHDTTPGRGYTKQQREHIIKSIRQDKNMNNTTNNENLRLAACPLRKVYDFLTHSKNIFRYKHFQS